jgi:hypothetical protein
MPRIGINAPFRIAALVQACWDWEIPTVASCQEVPETGPYIAFGPGSAERFVAAAKISRSPCQEVSWQVG